LLKHALPDGVTNKAAASRSSVISTYFFLTMSYSYTTVALTGVVALVVWFLIAVLTAHRRLSHIPGPFWAGWTDLWVLRAQFSGRISFILADQNTKYGTSYTSQ
jgi:hypothetical protein